MKFKKVISTLLVLLQTALIIQFDKSRIYASNIDEPTVIADIKENLFSQNPLPTPTPRTLPKTEVAVKDKDLKTNQPEDDDSLEIAVFDLPRRENSTAHNEAAKTNPGKLTETVDSKSGKPESIPIKAISQSELPDLTIEDKVTETPNKIEVLPGETEKEVIDKDTRKQNSSEKDFVIEFEDLAPMGLTETADEFSTASEFSLDVDGEMQPGSKLFSQLMAEVEAKEKASMAKLAETRLRLATESVANETGSENSPYIKKTTIVTTTTRYSARGFASAALLPAVNAATVSTGDAYRLVRLASMGEGVALPIEWAQHMVDAGKAHGVDPVLILEVCRQESRFKNNARSGANAHGLMQFIPQTAARFGIDPYNPRQAIFGGAKYLRFLLNTFRGELRSSLAGYNAGEGAVIAYATGRTIYPKGGKVINGRGIRTPFGIPPYRETIQYVDTIYSKYLLSLNRLRGW